MASTVASTEELAVDSASLLESFGPEDSFEGGVDDDSSEGAVDEAWRSSVVEVAMRALEQNKLQGEPKTHSLGGTPWKVLKADE